MLDVLASVDQSSASNIYALEEIKSLCLPLSKPLYKNYPAMKLGQSCQIEFFSQQLLVLAEKILREDSAAAGVDARRWVITAPPYHQLPAAANLLAGRTHQLLVQRGYGVAICEMRLNAQQVAVADQEELRESLDYSKSNFEQRVKHRDKLQRIDNATELAAHIAGSKILIINDINVTGAQQTSLSRMLTELGAHACHWLYVFNVAKAIADENPQIESAINTSQLGDLDAYAAVLCSDDIVHTAMCLSRLFSYDTDSFRYLVALMSPEVRWHLYQAAANERRYNSAAFAEKMAMLAAQQAMREI